MCVFYILITTDRALSLHLYDFILCLYLAILQTKYLYGGGVARQFAHAEEDAAEGLVADGAVPPDEA